MQAGEWRVTEGGKVSGEGCDAARTRQVVSGGGTPQVANLWLAAPPRSALLQTPPGPCAQREALIPSPAVPRLTRARAFRCRLASSPLLLARLKAGLFCGQVQRTFARLMSTTRR